jgi:CheY-like chemotaxis protein
MEQNQAQDAPAVLVAEDEPLIRMVVADVIAEAGFAVYEAGDADEAIRLLQLHGEICILFTDVNMPGSMDGLALAHSVRARWPEVKIIVTTGRTKLGDRDLPHGGVFLGKPYSLRHLLGAISDMAAPESDAADCAD